MAMNSFRIVESFQIFKNQLVCLLIVANFKAIEPFTFDNRMKGLNCSSRIFCNSVLKSESFVVIVHGFLNKGMTGIGIARRYWLFFYIIEEPIYYPHILDKKIHTMDS